MQFSSIFSLALLLTIPVTFVFTTENEKMSQSAALTLQNPVIQTNFPDPFILKVDDTYYAYSTNSNSRNVPVAVSEDLVNWTLRRDALPALPDWVNISRPDVWAPEVLRLGDEYLMYYTARDNVSGRQCIGLAVGDSPTGPFRDRSQTPFVCQTEEGGSIDASPFRDANGNLYLYWKNDGNCCSLPTFIYGQQLSNDGRSLVGERVKLLRNEKRWHGPVVEAPTMWLHDSRYYLFYSANVFTSEAYAVGYAVCDTPLGPCRDALDNPILASDLTRQPLVVGPGHQTLIQDEANNTWLVYHVWQVTPSGSLTNNRQMWMDRLIWEDGRPIVQGPTREAQAAPSTKRS
jgi:beta-xylosidase